MSRESREVYEFAGYRLDVGERTFKRIDGATNGSLPEKAFQTLTILVRNHGSLVTKRELLDAVWPDSFVEENNLDKSIHAIRHALGESRGEQKFIETVRKHGYRFVAEVRKADMDHRETPEAGAIARPTKRVSRARWLLVVAGALLIIASSLAAYWSFVPPGGDARKISIAILPLNSLTGGRTDEMIEFGITDSVIHQLSSTKGVVVRPFATVRHYAETPVDPLVAGKEQKTDFVLASNYQVLDGKIKITSQLIAVATGEVVDTYRAEKDATRIFATQDATAIEISNRILSSVGLPSNQNATARWGTQNEQAYRYYITGTTALSRRAGASASKVAIENFKKAIELDPSYGKAWAALAKAHVSFSHFPKEDAALAQEAIDRALSIDGELADAYDARATLRLYHYRDFAGAESDALRAMALSPNVGDFCSSYSFILAVTGRLESAIAEAKRAIDLDPRSLEKQRNLGIVLYFSRRYDEAIQQLERVAEMDPGFNTTFFWLTQAYEIIGDHERAFRAFVEHIQDPLIRTPENIASFREAYAAGGWNAASEARLTAWKKLEERGRPINRYQMALLAIDLGRHDEALGYLNWLWENQANQIVRIKVDPSMDPLREDPRFTDLLKRVGFEK